MIRTFRYPLKPNKAQELKLESYLLACQQLYNGALQERKDAYKRAKVSVTYNIQTAELAKLRNSDPEWEAVPSVVARSALKRIDKSFNNFFRRVKNGDKPGYPRFKSRSQYNTIGVGRAKVENEHVWVLKIGYIRFNEYRPIKGTIKNVEIKRELGKWFVCFTCDIGAAPAKPVKVPANKATGIDLNLLNFLTLSNGEETPIQKFYRKGQVNLKAKQQVLAKKKKGSNNRKEAKLAVGKAHKHISNQRLDFFRKLACELYKLYDLIAHEDLAIKNMVHGNLAKSIYDAAWGTFIEILTLKAESAGKWAIPVNPRGTSQRCSNCDSIVKKDLDEREHKCPTCGLEIGRDHNSGLNVLKLVPMADGEYMPIADRKPDKLSSQKVKGKARLIGDILGRE